MPRGLFISGFGKSRKPYIRRPPMDTAKFEFPEDVEFRNLRVEGKEGYIEITFRVPIPSSEESNALLRSKISEVAYQGGGTVIVPPGVYDLSTGTEDSDG